MIPPAPWALIDLDLDALPGTLALPESARAAELRFRLEGAVVGRVGLLPGDFPVPTAEMRRLAATACGATLAALAATGGAPLPFVSREAPEVPAEAFGAALASGALRDAARAAIRTRRGRAPGLSASVAVCTRHRPRALTACLAAIGAARTAATEVIVVDNGPDPETRAAAEAAGARYIPEARTGLSRARNAALRAATGDVVLFVDDDVLPERGWDAALLAAFDAPDIDVVCGRVLAKALESDAQIAFERWLGFGGMGPLARVFDATTRAAFRQGVPVWDLGAGASMAVRRRRALALGGFDERLGPGAAGGCGDDSEFWHRALFAGGRLVYEPLSVVRHCHRADDAALARQAQGYIAGHVCALFAQFAHDRDPGDLWRVLLIMPVWVLRQCLGVVRLRWLGIPAGPRLPLLRGYLSGLSHARLAFRPWRGAAPQAGREVQE